MTSAITKIKNESQLLLVLIAILFSLFEVTYAHFYLSKVANDLLIWLMYDAIVVFVFVLLGLKGAQYSYEFNPNIIVSLIKFLILLALLVFLYKLFMFFILSTSYERSSWLKFNYSSSFLSLKIIVGWLFLLTLESKKVINNKLLYCIYFLLLVVYSLDLTRLDLIFALVAVALFFGINYKYFIFLILISTIMAATMLIRGVDVLSDNLIHTFVGGLYLYESHINTVVLAELKLFGDSWLKGMLPGLNVLVATYADLIFNCNYSSSHFDSIFYRMHEMHYVPQLNVLMNSYFTAGVANIIVGTIFKLSCLGGFAYLAVRSRSNFFGRIGMLWFFMYFFTWTQWFYNLSSLGASIFIVALMGCVVNEIKVLIGKMRYA